MLKELIKKIKKDKWAITNLLISVLIILIITGAFWFDERFHNKISGLDGNLNQSTKPRVILPPIISKGSAIASSQPKAVKLTQQIPQNSGRSIRVPILTYHYIGNNPNPDDKARDILSVSPSKFDEEMGYLAKNGYIPITLDTMYAGLKGTTSLPAKPIVLTFDDGYIDFYVNAYPILSRYGFHAVSFIPTGLINQGYYLSWKQIEEMNTSGLISFEAHSINHPNLTILSLDQKKYQILQSKKDLEAHIGHPVNFFAYPYGISDASLRQLVKEAGYVGALGTWGETIESEGNIYDIPRIKISGGLDLVDFAKKI